MSTPPAAPAVLPWVRPGEPRERAGRLAALIYALAAALLLGTGRWLPVELPAGPHLALVAVTAATAGLLLLVPWGRLPERATLLPLLWALVLLGGVLGAQLGALSSYPLFFALAGLYCGLTQPPRTALALAPLTIGSALWALAGREPAAAAVELVGAALLSVVVGEVLAAVLQRSERASRSAEALLAAVTDLHEAGTEASAADLVADLASRLLQPDVALVMVASAPGSPRYVDRGSRGLAEPPGSLVVDTAVESGIGVAMREGRALFVADAPGSPLLAQSVVARLGLASVLFVPVPGEGGYLGCLVVGWRSPRTSLDRFSEQVVALLSSQAGSLLERLRSVGRLEHQARTDALTGLANRRVFLDALDRLRPGGAVVFLDLDHFKRLNDTRGHAAGDSTLVEFAAALRASVRDDDCAARYGGEEFALVLPSAASVDMTGAARVVVERLQRRWDGPVTFSVGIAVHRAGDAPSTTLARADAAVYEAKARGRDTVVVADAEEALVPAPRRS